MLRIQRIISCFFVFIIPLFIGIAAHAATTLKVGLIDSCTGPTATMTSDVRDAFKLVVEEVNDGGGVLGRKIQCIARDTMVKVEIGVDAAEDLINREQVDILVGIIDSPVALAVSDVSRRKKVPFINTYAKSEKIVGERGHRYVFSVCENTATIGKGAAVGLAQRPYQRYWIAGDNSEYGRCLSRGIWNHLKRLKPDVKSIGESWWNGEEDHLDLYFTSISEARPDAVIFAIGNLDTAKLMKAIKAAEISNKIPLFIHSATELGVVLSLGRDAPAGVMGTSNYHFYYPDSPENRIFLDKFMKRYCRYPKVGALYGYLAGKFIEKAYNRAGSVDKEKFIHSLEDLGIESPVGPVRMRACDHQAILPLFMGVTSPSPIYPFSICCDIITIPGLETMPPCGEVMECRSK